MNAILADNKCVWCSEEKLDEALTSQTPGHAMLDLERDGEIGKGAAKQLLCPLGEERLIWRHADVAVRFGISPASVSYIKRGINWRHTK